MKRGSRDGLPRRPSKRCKMAQFHGLSEEELQKRNNWRPHQFVTGPMRCELAEAAAGGLDNVRCPLVSLMILIICH